MNNFEYRRAKFALATITTPEMAHPAVNNLPLRYRHHKKTNITDTCYIKSENTKGQNSQDRKSVV